MTYQWRLCFDFNTRPGGTHIVRQRIRARDPGRRSSGRLPFKDIERKHSILDLILETVQGTGWGTSKDSAVFRYGPLWQVQKK